jgi:hypothetical protein
MWEIIKEILFAISTLVLFFFGGSALYLGIWQIATKEGTILDRVFYTGWGTLVLLMTCGSTINHYFF